MFDPDKFLNEIFAPAIWPFNAKALELFNYQAEKNAVYRDFLRHLHITPASVRQWEQIPCLPISFFKTHAIQTGLVSPEIIFTSSSTTGTGLSKHMVAQKAVYEQSFRTCFRQMIGPPDRFIIAALLPSYLEKPGSSLIYMVNDLIKQSAHQKSGYYTTGSQLPGKLLQLNNMAAAEGRKLVLFGVSYALLDLLDMGTPELPDTFIIETGGMKGRQKEITRAELHQQLQRLRPAKIFSEYGMTELLSQAYAEENRHFKGPPWMRVIARELNDPFNQLPFGKAGPLNIIDLANVHSCAFIAASDMGIVYEDGFVVLGRTDHSDLRGCNLLHV